MIVIDDKSNTPLYLQIYNQIKSKILTGVLSKGSKLPPTRVLAKTLNVGRNTVEYAYAQLTSEGYISGKVGSGFTICTIDTFLHKPLPQTKPQNIFPKASHTPQTQPNFDFQYGKLNSTDFPLKIWRKYTNQALTSTDAHFLSSYNDRHGELGLRKEIVRYLRMSRGVQCESENVVLCSGTLPSLDLICHLIKEHISDIAIENPSYDGARAIFHSNGFNVIPVNVNNNGINLELLVQTSAKLVYLTPSHQFPTGSVMPIQNRLKVLDWAHKNDGIIIEDDYDSELRYNSRPIPSLQSLDSKGSVIYLGTFSKTLAPGLRLSYMVLPEIWLERYNRALMHYHCSVSWLEQKTLELFMSNGHWERHLRKICLSQKKKHDLIVKTTEDLLGRKVTIHGRNAGSHILLEFKGFDEQELIEKARNAGVIVYPVSKCWINLNEYKNNMILLGYGGLTEQEILDGLKLLNIAWFKN